MEDELEDRIFYQTYISHMKLLSKFAVGLPLNSSCFSYIWRLIRFYIIKPEVVLLTLFLVIIFMYIQAVEVWSRSLVNKLRLSVSSSIPSKSQKLQYFKVTGDFDKSSWELKEGNVAVFAVQGRRPKMEDRFVVNENINGTGVHLYAVFDGHGGEFAANYARDNLINNLNSRIIELKQLISKGVDKNNINKQTPPSPAVSKKLPSSPPPLEKKPSFKKYVTEEGVRKQSGVITDPFLLEKLDSLPRAITREVKLSRTSSAPILPPDITTYIETNSTINFGKLVTDEVLAADRLLVEAAKKTMDVAGTTVLIALVEGSKLIVANVGDSRGVMCDFKGRAIPLSFDHKPQQSREKKRIEEAGGSVTFNGVWRVAGILATSRAMGDYPLKDKKLVIADPDILTFDLSDHKPQFLILASDGLWDTFSNEEAVSFIKSRLHEPHFGAKSITLQSYYRGSLDNITVLIINLSKHSWV
ncbi:protein phosphatase 1L [Rhodnius prolixus]|uniref:Protein phosphatase type 2c n=3 Tax=Rhodnius TaxID=13248 RepID=R4G3X5_RHOPR